MSTGRISPVLCSFTHSSLSLAGSTFRSNWSTSSTVWNEENKNPNVKAHFRQSLLWHAEQLWACQHCICRQMRAACAWDWMDKTGLNVQPCGKQRRGRLNMKKQRQVSCARQQPGSLWLLSCNLHLTPNTTVLNLHAPHIVIFDKQPAFNKEKKYIYTYFLFQQWNNSVSSQHKQRTSRSNASCWEN